MESTDRSAPNGTSSQLADVRVGCSVADLKQAILDNLLCAMGRGPRTATLNDAYMALALTVRDRVLQRSVLTLETYFQHSSRTVAYLSAEYLPGPHLANNMLSLGITENARKAVTELGFDFDKVVEQEEEPGLGNGGLGRLASCYLDSLATLEIPATGYGIRYEFGIFDQVIHDGWQVEITDKWLRLGNPWEIPRPELSYQVNFGGRTDMAVDPTGMLSVRWVPETVVKGVAYDTPILGYKVGTSNRLRLWKAEAIEAFDFAAFNHGDYYLAVEDKMFSENITKVLYPNDDAQQGKILRLEQQFFFTSCSLQDMIRIHLETGGRLEQFHEKWAVQLNDTHPSVGVAELMRLLIDVHGMGWDSAWHVTTNTFGYTNHTLLPEALEKWPLPLFSRLLPRHTEIIYEINRRFLDEVKARYPGDEARLGRMSLIDESGDKFVRMAHLATVGSHFVNGVARLHSELLRQTVMRDFADMWPEKFGNVTNGVTPRRFIALSNPPLADLITQTIGDDGWLKDLDELRRLEPFAGDPAFRSRWRAVKLQAKRRLARLIEARCGIEVDPESLFDIQAKRLHEYKRQHLNALYIVYSYLRLKRNPESDVPSRTFIFGAKAAPGYFMAKLIIKFINSIGMVVNTDPTVANRLKVVFYPDYNVKNAQDVYPAADLSEQISTAGKEASGTGNMKFSLNGALTIGTLDGANVEIREEVGAENFFLFGLNAAEVADLKSSDYRPRDFYERDERLRETIDFVAAGGFSDGNTSLFAPLIGNLLDSDPFLVLADFAAYLDAQSRVDALWGQSEAWTRASILNSARMGKFSSDRSIRDYSDLVWRVSPIQAEAHL